MAFVYPSISVEDTISGKGSTALARIRVATTVAGTLSSSFANGSIVDGITLATDDRILIKNQASGVENGIYNVQPSGAPVRAQDFDNGAEVGSTLLVIDEGTTNSDTIWMCTNNFSNDIAGVNSLTFLQVAGSGVDGNVTGPVSSTNNAVVRFNGTTGRIIQNSGVILSGTNSLTGLVDIGMSGDILDANGNKIIDFITVNSAVNSISITNAATGNGPSIGVSGEANRGITMLDSNANAMLILGTRTSAVNQITIANAATGNAPSISTTGGDTNVNLSFTAKGTGVFTFDAGSTSSPAEIRLLDNTGGEYIGLCAAATIPTSFTLVLPDSFGSAGQFLRTDGNNPATLTWTTPAGTGDVVGPASATDNAIARFDLTTGKLIQNSGITISDTNVLTGATSIVLESGTFDTTIAVATQTTSAPIVTIPDLAGVSGNFVITNASQTLTNKTLTSPSITGATFSLDDTGSAFNLSLVSTSSPVLSADRALTLNVNNANRTISLAGNLTFGGTVSTADALTTSGAFPLTLTSTASTNVTLPTTGTLATLTGTETFTNKTITSGRYNELDDTNGNMSIILSATSSAVNEITVVNAATGNTPNINASGSDTNVSLGFATKGTGVFNFNGGSTAGEIRLFDDNNSNYVGVKSPATISSNFSLNLPTGVGSVSTVLTTDGSNPATLTWANPLPFQTSANSTSSTTTTSATNAVISGMTITPASGRYLVLFSGRVQSVTNTSVVEISVYNNAVQNTVTIRTNTHPTSSFLHITTISLEVVNGSQAIDIRWRRVSGTGTPTMTNRQMILIRVL